MRITRHARSAAILLAAALFLAALPAWADDSVPAPVADSPGAETPSRSRNLVDGALDAPEASPDRDRILSRLASRPRRLPSRPQVAPAPQEPPSFGELDRFVPPNARASLRESWQRWSPEVETGLKRGYGALPDEAQRRLARIGELALRPAGRRGLLAALVALGILLVALRTLRGHGDLVVCIAYPNDLRGSFTVMISQRKPSTGRAPRSERDAAPGARTEHHLVARGRGLTPALLDHRRRRLFAGAGEDPIEQPFESQP